MQKIIILIILFLSFMGCTGAQVNEKMLDGMTPDQYADYEI